MLFKNINLNKLTKKELVLLLHLVEHYQKDDAENFLLRQKKFLKIVYGYIKENYPDKTT